MLEMIWGSDNSGSVDMILRNRPLHSKAKRIWETNECSKPNTVHWNQPPLAKGLKEQDQVRTSNFLTKSTFLQGYLAGVWHFPIQSFTVLLPSLPNIWKQWLRQDCSLVLG